MGWAFVFLLQVSPSVAQSNTHCHFSVKGTIGENHTHTPIPGVTVFIKELGKGTVTNDKGEYVIDHLCLGSYTLICNHLAYHADTMVISVSHKPVEQNFVLKEADIQLNAVIITAQKAEDLITQQTEELKGIELDKTRGLSLGESLKGITGINSIQTGPSISKPVIHGMHSNRILLLNNGIRQEGQQWGSEHAPEIDPFVATKFSVIKGAAGVRYGSDAIGGVILVEPEELPRLPGINGELNLVALSNSRQGVVSGILQGNLKKLKALSWRLQSTGKRAGNYKTPDYYLKNSGLAEFNFSSALAYQKENYGIELFYSRFATSLGIFAGSHIGNLNDLKTAFESEHPLVESGFSYHIDRPFQHITHHLVKGKAYFTAKSLGKFSLIYAQQLNNRQEYDAHRPRNDLAAQLTQPELRYTLNTYTTDVVWEHKPIKEKATGSMGISTTWQSNVIGGRFLIPNFRNRGIGIFALERWANKRWEAEAGIRYDYRLLEVFMNKNNVIVKPERQFTNVSGTVGGAYTLNDHLSFKANLGMAWRPPAVNELYSDGVHHGEAIYVHGDSSLQAETAYNSTGSLHYKSAKLQAEMGLYYNFVNNYVYLLPLPDPKLTIRGAFPAFQYTQANGLFRGVDATINYQVLPILTFTSKFSLVRAWNRGLNEPLPFIPADRPQCHQSFLL